MTLDEYVQLPEGAPRFYAVQQMTQAENDAIIQGLLKACRDPAENARINALINPESDFVFENPIIDWRQRAIDLQAELQQKEEENRRFAFQVGELTQGHQAIQAAAKMAREEKRQYMFAQARGALEGSCRCLTKDNDPGVHSNGCPFKALSNIIEILDSL